MEKRTALVGLIVSCRLTAPAQTLDPPLVAQYPWIKENTLTQRVVPYAPLREADVMWAKRVWREIDLREKINHPLYFPMEPTNDRMSLFDVIKKSLLEDQSLTAYDPGPLLQNDEFTRPLTRAELRGVFEWTETVIIEDSTGTPVPVPTPVRLTTSDVIRYRLKEDWFFDRQRGRMEVCIMGIAPMKTVKGEDGEIRGYAPIFWLYYPELRYVLANSEAFNTYNDAERRSLENLFWTRRFNSYVIKESNVYDRPVASYRQGIDALMESERIGRELLHTEQDLWNF